ncbi:MAG: NAD-dependent epimerase/dehydratase family protein [Geitlerinemataceae cyanobacterium]
MNVLVTGANGFTGSHLVRALLDRGDRVTALVRLSSDVSRLQGLNVTYAYGDVTDRASLDKAMAGIDRVYHIAAFVELGLVDADKMRRVNIDGTRNILEAARAAGVQKLLYCSTVGIYGDTKGETIDETFERQQQEFSSAYDETKLKAQELVNAAVADGMDIVSIMPSGIFGADDPHFGPVIKNFLKGRLRVWAGGDRVTGIVHVDDLVELMLLAMDKAEAGEHFIGTAGDLTTREMFDILSDAGGVTPPTELPEPLVRLIANILDPIGRLFSWNPPIGRERAHYVYDRCVRITSAKAQRELDWKPRPVETVLLEIVQKLR